MNICILSNLSLQLASKKLGKRMGAENQLEFIYTENIEAHLQLNPNNFSDQDLLIVHTDSWFEQEADKQNGMYKAIHKLMNAFPTVKVAIPNQRDAYSLFPWGHKTNSFSSPSQYLDQTGLADMTELQVYDFAGHIAKMGFDEAYNFNLGYVYQLPYKPVAVNALVSIWQDTIARTFAEEKKVIVLDCDNTLWGGVVGEDGVKGIKVGQYPEGMFYLQFQKFLKTRKDLGFVLCLASKNNETDVKEAFDALSMPLAWEDFVIKKVDWNNKADNIKQIAKQLNVGLSSLIFIDDSDYELEFVRQNISEVLCFKQENNWDALFNLFQHHAFSKKHTSKEDKDKSEFYKNNLQRENLANEAVDKEDFLKTLKLKMSFAENDKNAIARLAQMTGKTNQFNFNKESLSEAEMQEYMDSGNYVLSCSLKDKYGDYGIIGLMLVDVNENKAKLRNFLLSCRALGRNVEYEYMNTLDNLLVRESLDLAKIYFTKTDRNLPAEEFYKELLKKDKWKEKLS